MHPWICLTSMPAIAEPPSRLSTSLGTCSEYIACTLSVLTWHAFLPLWLHRFDSAHIFSCVAPFGKNILTISLSSFPNTNLLHRFRFFEGFFYVFFCWIIQIYPEGNPSTHGSTHPRDSNSWSEDLKHSSRRNGHHREPPRKRGPGGCDGPWRGTEAWEDPCLGWKGCGRCAFFSK